MSYFLKLAQNQFKGLPNDAKLLLKQPLSPDQLRLANKWILPYYEVIKDYPDIIEKKYIQRYMAKIAPALYPPVSIHDFLSVFINYLKTYPFVLGHDDSDNIYFDAIEALKQILGEELSSFILEFVGPVTTTVALGFQNFSDGFASTEQFFAEILQAFYGGRCYNGLDHEKKKEKLLLVRRYDLADLFFRLQVKEKACGLYSKLKNNFDISSSRLDLLAELMSKDYDAEPDPSLAKAKAISIYSSVFYNLWESLTAAARYNPGINKLLEEIAEFAPRHGEQLLTRLPFVQSPNNSYLFSGPVENPGERESRAIVRLVGSDHPESSCYLNFVFESPESVSSIFTNINDRSDQDDPVIVQSRSAETGYLEVSVLVNHSEEKKWHITASDFWVKRFIIVSFGCNIKKNGENTIYVGEDLILYDNGKGELTIPPESKLLNPPLTRVVYPAPSFTIQKKNHLAAGGGEEGEGEENDVVMTDVRDDTANPTAAARGGSLFSRSSAPAGSGEEGEGEENDVDMTDVRGDTANPTAAAPSSFFPSPAPARDDREPANPSAEDGDDDYNRSTLTIVDM